MYMYMYMYSKLQSKWGSFLGRIRFTKCRFNGRCLLRRLLYSIDTYSGDYGIKTRAAESELESESPESWVFGKAGVGVEVGVY